MRHLLRAILPGVLLTGAILVVVKLIATGNAHGLTHGGWGTATDILGWVVIVLVALGLRARERNRRIAALAAEIRERELRNVTDVTDV